MERTPLDRYNRLHYDAAVDESAEEIERLLDKVRERAAEIRERAAGNTNWGHIGDMRHMIDLLHRAAGSEE